MPIDLPEQYPTDHELNALVRFYFNEEPQEGEEATRPTLPDIRLPQAITSAGTRLVTSSSIAATTTTLAYGLQTIGSAVRSCRAYQDWEVHAVIVNPEVGIIYITPSNPALHGDGQQTVFWVVRYRRG